MHINDFSPLVEKYILATLLPFEGSYGDRGDGQQTTKVLQVIVNT